MNKQDIYFLRKTLDLAKKAEGNTSPNPMVGAVIVKNNREISCGYHKKSGEAHAEIEAIDNAKANISGATLYVNLEPCCHFGKTPPCVDKVISSGIKRVVA
ncbi:MAG: bifunctional diaminohydroxyphosphoribosylaminopyrimidine deaminase/5-amino-6-(5-phosphoribosylamino)uracil reductase RibD, partial [Candidatus Omnitrophica bacterium]|nr:bifunctional diaminohydroxyphosphoribosylaminopyrimidine deaminase/5-amino-6-(5-phosphoribosylamino)uracil reductase RibD [Candidatus Omnitrophota bacterium]